jgi:glycosyltransferase involved in cell wall biosynthesis
LVQPSIIEGFGLSIVEAMAAKIPVLVSDVEGPMELIGNGRFGYFFKTENKSECANMIELIISLRFSKDFRDRILASYTHAIENFNVRDTALKYIANYN